MKNIKYYLIIIILTLFFPAQSLVIGASVYMKILNGQKYFIYCLEDAHQCEITKQIDDLTEVALKFDNNVLLLTEIHEEDSLLCDEQRSNDYEIIHTYDSFKKNNLSVVGTDKRSLIASSIDRIKKSLIKYKSYHDQILQYNDCPYLNELYKQFAKVLEQKMALLFFELNKLKEQEINYEISCLFLAADLYAFFNEIEMLHQIFIKQCQHNILYYGGMHIKRIRTHLTSLGYKKIFSYGYNFQKEVGPCYYLLTSDNKSIIIGHKNELNQIPILNIKDIFDDMNNRFNIFDTSRKIISKL